MRDLSSLKYVNTVVNLVNIKDRVWLHMKSNFHATYTQRVMIIWIIYHMVRNIGMELNVAFGKINRVLPNVILPTFKINSVGAYTY